MNVLIVDDLSSQRMIFRQTLEELSPEIKVTDFGNPVDALLWSQSGQPDLVLLDYQMPKLDGIEFARRFRAPGTNRDVAIILITVVDEEPVLDAALNTGIVDFLTKPVRPYELRARCRNLLELHQRRQSLKMRTLMLERRLLSNAHELEEREREILLRLNKAKQYRHGANNRHAERMPRYAGLLAEALGLSDAEVRLIERAAPLVDIGKIAISDTILLKPGPLNADEYEAVKRHPILAYDLLHDSHSHFIQASADIALHYQERWDGSGYPQGLTGDQTPIAARIVAVADVLDALTSARPYRKAWTFDAALEYLGQQAGVLFDPDVVEALLDRREQVQEIYGYYIVEAVLEAPAPADSA